MCRAALLVVFEILLHFVWYVCMTTPSPAPPSRPHCMHARTHAHVSVTLRGAFCAPGTPQADGNA